MRESLDYSLPFPPSADMPAVPQPLSPAAVALQFDADLLDAVAACSGDYISIVDRAGVLLYLSQTYAHGVGREREELLGKTEQEIVPDAENSVRLRREYEAVFQTGDLCSGDTRRQTPQGWRDVEYTLTPLFDKARQVSAVMSVGKDVTQRNQFQSALRRNADNLDFALNGAQIGTFYCDWPFDKIIWNDTCKEHFFLPHDAEIDFNLFYALLHPEDRERTRQAVDRCMAERIQYDVEYRTVAPDGRWRWINAIGRGFYDAQGAPYRFDGITIDITRRKLAEADMRRHSEAVQAMNARLKHAMQETHHRVRNSLQLVSAFIDMQASEHAEAVPTENMRHLNTQVQTLSAVHNVLTTEAKENLEANQVSVKALLEKLLPLLQNIAQARHIAFFIDEARVSAKSGTALALITNELILNAIKHGKGLIEVRFRQESEHGLLEVADDGGGFPDSFDPVSAANTGLELVDRLARYDLNGKVAYANRPAPGGALVTLLFPITDESR